MTGSGGPKRLLTIGHSYAVGVNRRLADALARAGDWDVTVAAPRRFHGDFGWHTLEPVAGEQCTLAPVPVYGGRPVHLMLYGWPLRRLLREQWDLVHCWEEPYVAAAAQVARWNRRGTPLVLATFQNIDKTYPPPFSWFEKYHTFESERNRGIRKDDPDRVERPGMGESIADHPSGSRHRSFRSRCERACRDQGLSRLER